MEWLKRRLGFCAVFCILLFSAPAISAFAGENVQPVQAVVRNVPDGQVIAGFAAQLIQNNGAGEKPETEDKTAGEKLTEEISNHPVIFGANILVFFASIAAGYRGYKEIKE